MIAIPLPEREATIATLIAKIAIADARSTWGTKVQRAAETANAERFRARLAEVQA